MIIAPHPRLSAVYPLLFMTAVIWLCSVGVAHATVGSILCGIYNDELIGSNGIGKGVATMAVISVGISAALGKASWGAALMVFIGIGILFGASAVVTAFGAQAC